MEIEIKVRAKNFAAIRRLLKKLGTRYIGKKHQVDYYYSPEYRPFSKRQYGKVIRVRYDVIKNTARLEFHHAHNDYAAHETELEVGNIETVREILRLMKCKLECVVDKKREQYKKGRIEIVLDDVKGLGKFIEVEIMGDDSVYNRQRIAEFLSKLGFCDKDFMLDERYHSMLLAKKGKKYAYF